MKSLFNTILSLLALLSFEKNAYSLSENQIREICQKKQRGSTCIKNLKFKKYNLLEGHRIEIPVIPYKK
tara:strand:+ start:1213 stop:1419 length:207 start_codon:yes stop_codon:yes gene_type:complete